MPGGRHRFVFVGKVPLAFRVFFALFLVNSFLLFVTALGEYFLPKASPNLPPCEAFADRGVHAPEIVCWYVSHSIAIQFALLALVAAVFIIFRKRVRYVDRT
jgi:hypothetical protein